MFLFIVQVTNIVYVSLGAKYEDAGNILRILYMKTGRDMKLCL